MQIILREHVDNLGRRGEIIEVANGYARNYLIPQKLALLVTDNSRRQIERERAAAEIKDAEERQVAEALAQQILLVDCVVSRKVGEQDVLYGSVTTADVAECLKEFNIDKRKIQLSEPIKKLGEFTVPVKIHRDVTAEVKLKVVKDEES
ncbi:MAG TPA: 50S ribosomal protein L9 [Acidobacteria bacterium]|jgi:large subunit ribosomal protein L9|nr:50S ribosomal protein L9 [Acidobacteriota bacterium]|tara:strand:+ start:55 stop:501 length:447 start_codon:yes stop_codon:yes gene_type:complete